MNCGFCGVSRINEFEHWWHMCRSHELLSRPACPTCWTHANDPEWLRKISKAIEVADALQGVKSYNFVVNES